jgi:DNA polymerase-3 subunit alpha
MFSALDAVPSPEEWLEWALKTNTPGISITDHGTAISMYHAIRFKDMIKKYNKDNKTSYAEDAVIGIPGVELYVKEHKDDKSHMHITAWAVSNQGYFNLMKLSSLAYNDVVKYFGSVKPRVTYELISQYSEGICFGTGCIASPMGRAIMAGDYTAAENWYLRYQQMFGDKLYVEIHPTDLTHDFDKKTGGFIPIQPNECSCDGNMQKAYNLFLLDMVDKHGGKVIPATDAHFILPEDKRIQDCLLKAGSDLGWYFHQSYHQKESDVIFYELKHHLGDRLTEERFTQWIYNSYEVMNAAKNINISFDYHLPKIPIPAHIQRKSNDYNKQTYYLLIEKIQKHGRWINDPVYVDRFKKEIDTIFKNEKLNFIPYFLLYEDICAFARSQGIFQNIGRGSAGGSLISYYLKIIHIDPVKHNLPFERFLSHARIRAGSFPDIDLDLSSRAKVIKYLQDKYKAGFAQIATFQKMKTKNAIKDAMWSIYSKNRNDPEVKAICDQIPDSPQGVEEYDFLYGYTDQEETYHPGLVEQSEIVANFFASHPQIEEMVKKLIGIVRGFGRHASAFVISTTDLSNERVPTMLMEDKDVGQRVLVTQYEAPMVEKSGLVKADILAVTTLEAVQQCMDLVKERTGHDYMQENEVGIQEVYRLPEEQAVYVDFYNKKTDSSFQFNTQLIKGLVQDFYPLSRKDLSDFTALARPGAMDAPIYDTTALKYYIAVRNGSRELELIHEDLRSHTDNGVFVFQESIMSFLVDIVGYTWEEADQTRGAISKKKQDVIMAAFDRIRAACRNRGWNDEAIETICQQILAFSRYSFNRSHSASYGELGYITMYLKHFHPLEWWTAVLNTTDKEDKVRHYISIIGDKLSSPSLKVASNRFTISGDKIVAPLSAIKHIGPNSVAELITKGPYSSLEDFVKRINHSKVNAGHFAALVKARATDCFIDKALLYGDARIALVNQYKALRNSKKIDESLYDVNPLTIYTQERETNTVFNKPILGDLDVVAELQKIWPGFRRTQNKGIPLMMGTTGILRDLKIAAGMVGSNVTDQEFGFVLLYKGSSMFSGISKKTGRPFEMLKVMLFDGIQEVEAVHWRCTNPLRFPVGSLVYVRGTVTTGFKYPVSINISEIRRIIEE